MKLPKVAIIICTYNQDILLEKCLLSLKNKTNYKNYRIFLVDDKSKKKIGINMKKKFPVVNLIINKKNLGFSKSNNIGIKKALKEYSPDYFLLLNDDTEIVDKNWLKTMIEVGESDEKIGILGCKLIYPDGSLQSVGGHIKWGIITKISNLGKEGIIDVSHVMGAFMLIKKEVIKKVGFLDEIFSPYLLEDTDYCLRAKEKGFEIKSVSYIKIIHKKGKTLDFLKDRKRILIRFKNDILFSKRHLKGWNKFFRIFIYLPLFAIFKKKKDIEGFKIKNLKLRKDILMNLTLYFKSLSKIYNTN